MKKINNKVLLIGLIALIGIFALSRIFRSPRLESNVRKELVQLDTAKITEVRIAAPGAELLTLKRDGKKWTATQGDQKFDADLGMVGNVVSMFQNIHAERMVSRKKDKWESFKVDQAGINVSAFYGGSKEADIWLGKNGFNQGQGNPQFGGQQSITPYTYVRLSDEDEVYMVTDFLSVTSTVKDWRNKLFLRVPKEQVTRVGFTYPADSSFVLEKRDSLWFAAGQQADQALVDNYLNQLASKEQTAFTDALPVGPALMTIEVSGTTGVLAKVESWMVGGTPVMMSSLQPGVYFSSTPPGDLDLFIGRKKLLKK